VSELKALHIMCKRDTESLKVAPKSVLSNRGENLQGTHLTEEGFLRVRFSPGGGRLSPGCCLRGLSPYTAHNRLSFGPARAFRISNTRIWNILSPYKSLMPFIDVALQLIAFSLPDLPNLATQPKKCPDSHQTLALHKIYLLTYTVYKFQ